MGLFVLGLIAFIVSFLLKGLDGQTKDSVNLRPAAWTSRIVGVLMMVGGILMASVVIIPTGYAGVLLRFGALQGQLAEGINFVMPGVNTVIPIEVRTQKDEATATAASRDLQVVTTNLALNYRLETESVGKLYQQVGAEYRTRIIAPTLQESVKVVTARYTAEDLIRNRAQVKSEVEAEIGRRLSIYFIKVEPGGLSITNFDFSPEFNKAIEAKQVAQQETEKQKYLLQRAELEKQTEVARAEGKAQANKLTAQSLKEMGGGLVIAREWIEKWDGKLPSVSAGGSGGQFIVDLSSLMKQGQ
ncbi:MAG: prohibitin family protein [Fimbriimonadaceae bacterium]|nr:prohibitin family protein [Fimbriimonadaceae bacterium]QYK57811.1 MAG: prohibitin family protein [Fimbriimonadaceae bacterium]